MPFCNENIYIVTIILNKNMYFERKAYLKQLVDGSKNDMVKIVTGIRRCGKSYLLFNLFRTYLLENGTDEQHTY